MPCSRSLPRSSARQARRGRAVLWPRLARRRVRGAVGLGTATLRVGGYTTIAETFLKAPGFVRHWDDVAKVLLHNAETKEWITYEDPQSMRLKGEYIASQNLAGAMFWELSNDDGRLLGALRAGLGLGNQPRIPPRTTERTCPRFGRAVEFGGGFRYSRSTPTSTAPAWLVHENAPDCRARCVVHPFSRGVAASSGPVAGRLAEPRRARHGRRPRRRGGHEGDRAVCVPVCILGGGTMLGRSRGMPTATLRGSISRIRLPTDHPGLHVPTCSCSPHRAAAPRATRTSPT